MKIKNISKEVQLVDWVEVKAWDVIDTVHACSILRNYSHLFEAVKEWEKEVKEEKNEEVKEEKKTAKKSK